MSRRRGLALVGAVIVALVAVLLLSRPSEDRYQRPDLDPRGTGPGGTAALVALLRDSGATVRLGGQPRAGDDLVLQIQDTFSAGAADALEAWVEDGGTLVTTDPFAALAPGSDISLVDAVGVPGATCEVDALLDLGPVVPALPAVFPPDARASSCFGEEGAAALDLRRRGAGLVVALSSVEPFQNANLDDGDSAVLATALLAPFEGVQVRILDPLRFVGDDEDVGDGTILGALPTRGRQALQQLVVAFLVWGLVRGRRLGRPVTEELPVPLPASDLVLASGRLLDRNGDEADAAERLRRRARRDLGIALGLGPDPVPHELAAALVSRAGIDPALVHHALLAPVGDGDALVSTSAHLDRLRQELRR